VYKRQGQGKGGATASPCRQRRGGLALCRAVRGRPTV